MEVILVTMPSGKPPFAVQVMMMMMMMISANVIVETLYYKPESCGFDTR
jgi:hypothetical protein